MTDKPGFKFAFMEGFVERQEIEDVRVLQGLARKVGMGSGQELGEVGDRSALPSVSIRLDHYQQNISAPAVGESLLHVPTARGQILDFLQQ